MRIVILIVAVALVILCLPLTIPFWHGVIHPIIAEQQAGGDSLKWLVTILLDLAALVAIVLLPGAFAGSLVAWVTGRK